jgi:transaldolase
MRRPASSVFAGRLGDLGIDYRPIVARCGARARMRRRMSRVIWASTREVFNVIEAHDMGCAHHHRARRRAEQAARDRHQTGDDLALGGVKAFRDDTLAAGLDLPGAKLRQTAAE